MDELRIVLCERCGCERTDDGDELRWVCPVCGWDNAEGGEVWLAFAGHTFPISGVVTRIVERSHYLWWVWLNGTQLCLYPRALFYRLKVGQRVRFWVRARQWGRHDFYVVTQMTRLRPGASASTKFSPNFHLFSIDFP